jgi:O-antigen/teichoic acid export membrane protein
MTSSTLNHLGVVVAGKVVPLASLLIYSHFLDPAEYGVVSLFFSYIWIFGIALTLNLHTAIGRFIYDPAYNIGELVGTTLCAIASLFVLGAVIALSNLDTCAALLSLPPASIPFLLAVCAGQVAESLLVQVLTAREQSGRLLLAVATRSLGSMAATVVLLHALRTERHFAVIYAEGISSLALAAYLLLVLRHSRPWKYSRKILRTFVSYSVPLIPYMLSITLLAQFDRIMIDKLFGKAATGLYSMGFNIGILVVMIAGALLNALNPRFFAGMANQRYTEVQRDSSSVFAICTIFSFALALFGPEVAALIIPEKYNAGLRIIPLIALGGLASVTFQIWGRVINYTNKTYLLSLVAVTATILKIALNTWLLPLIGYWAGAITTCVAYGFMAAAIVILINKNLDSLKVSLLPEWNWLIGLCLAVIIQGWAGAFIGSMAMLLLLKALLLLIVLLLLRSRAISSFYPNASHQRPS